jgi:hypothetical protein
MFHVKIGLTTSTFFCGTFRRMTGKVFISQSDRFAQNFGYVHRSSGMFYFRASPSFRSTITLWNHFKHKNNVEAAILASVRDMSGKLIARESLGFSQGEVINYSPLSGEDFEGSVEIEAFSAGNLKVPFTAISAIYEAPESACLLHAYGRVYSTHEIEEQRTVPVGREIGWTLRDRPGVRSFCVLHNGAQVQPAQQVTLHVQNHKGERRSLPVALKALPPFATVRLVAADHMPDLETFLGSQEGTAGLDFVVNGAFTRLMVGNETIDGREFQVTHSNFNYADHISEALPGNAEQAFIVIPDLNDRPRRVIVYPEVSSGAYVLETEKTRTAFKSGDMVVSPVSTGTLTFSRHDGALPARIVTGLIIDGPARLPAELSTNIVHARTPDKRLSWGVCAAPERLRTALVITDFAQIKGGFPANGTMELRAYSPVNHSYIAATLSASDMPALNRGVDFADMLPGLAEHLAGQTGYFTLYSDYGGLFCYTLLEGPNGSLSFEHCF